jgi:hypothetical protein
MRQHRRSLVATAGAALLLSLIAGPTALAGDPDGRAAVRGGSEQMAPVPDPAELGRLAALYPKRAPTIEGQGDPSTIAAAVTTHNVYVKSVADEEYRAYFGSGAWQQWTNSIIEYADDELYVQFGINYTVREYLNWDSAPDTSRSVCNLLSELETDSAPGTQDVVAGFSKNATSGSKGCAQGNYTIVLWHTDPNVNNERFAEWTTQQHETSHTFGAPDRYPDPNNLHPNDVMEDQYHFYNTWCTKAGYNDWGIVNSHAGKYR